jgi:hypothetical protein
MEVLSVIREKTVRTVLTVRQKVEADSCVEADSRTERTVFRDKVKS